MEMTFKACKHQLYVCLWKLIIFNDEIYFWTEKLNTETQINKEDRCNASIVKNSKDRTPPK